MLFFAWPTLAPCSEIIGEMRGVWLPAWEFPTPKRLVEVIHQIRAANFNTIFLEVRYRSDALYIPNKSNELFTNPEKRSSFIAGGGDDYDPLDLAIREAHRLGMDLHAWVTVYIATGRGDTLDDYHYPADWLSCKKDGTYRDGSSQYWLDAGVPGVNEYLAGVFLDIISNYDLDGFHLDYIRYEHGFGYSPISVARFREIYDTSPGDNPDGFIKWRQDCITDLIERLRQGIDWASPGLPLSVAVFGSLSTSREEVFQDWPLWIDEELVDFVIPMCYAESADVMGGYAQVDLSAAPKNRVVVGLGILERSGGRWDTPQSLVERMERCIQLESPGVVVFAYGGLADEGGKRFELFREEFFDRYLPPPIYQVPIEYYYPVVELSTSTGKLYSLRAVEAVPHRHAIMVAKMMVGLTDAPVFIGGDEGGYDVFIGKETSIEGINILRKEMEEAQS